MEVRCSVPERTVLSVAMLTMESADRALMSASVVVRAGTWLRTGFIVVMLVWIVVLGL